MAIRILPFHAIVLRPFVSQDITQAGWRMLVANAAKGLYDGEIMAFGSMDPATIRRISSHLERIGFNGPMAGDRADFAVFDRGEGAMPSWLERVEIRFLADNRKSAAWKMVNSEVFILCDRNEPPQYSTKGYEVDWAPFIGRISC